MTLKTRSEIDRALGLIEGLAFGMPESWQADALVEVVERIESALADDYRQLEESFNSEEIKEEASE